MEPKRIGILIGVLAVLTAVAWFSGVFDFNFSTLEVPDWSLNAEDVSMIAVSADGDSLAAQLDGDHWTVTSPLTARADSAFVTRLVRRVADLELKSVVSTNPSRYVTYGVDSLAKRVWITGGESATLFIGKSTPDGLGSFVRVNEDPRVFSTSTSLRVDSDVSQWRNKVVLDLPISQVTEAAVEPSNSPGYRVQLTDGVWTAGMEDDVSEPADSAAVMRWLTRFAPLRGDGFVDDSVVAASSPAGTISFRTSGGSSVELVFTENDTHLMVESTDEGTLLHLSKGRKTSLFPGYDTLKQ